MALGRLDPVETNDAHDARAWCLFKCDAHPFAVRLEAVAEIVEADRLVRLALAPARLLGLGTVRRDVIPVVRLIAPRVDEGGMPHGARRLILVLRTAQGLWGVRIDRDGTGVAECALGVPAAVPAGLAPAAVLGTVRRGEAVHTALDPESAWRVLRDEIEGHYRALGERSSG